MEAAAPIAQLTKLEMMGRFRMLTPFSIIGVHPALTLGMPMRVKVKVLRNGGSGIS
jgi:hypothetical protein